jgi:transposase, IS30 family
MSQLVVSHETIYQALYLQGRGGLKAELTEALRTGRARRRRKGPNLGRGARGRLKDVVLISQRPAEAADRAVPGHWEGDLILGRGGKSQIATIVERTTRFTLLVGLPDNRKAITVRDAVAAKIVELPEHLRRSLTWDQGKEMAAHVSFTVATDLAVYFCDPHSPWQRGTNENTNGLLRQYLPRSLDVATVTARQLDAIAAELNERPRETLGWMTPSEKFSELVAMAA